MVPVPDEASLANLFDRDRPRLRGVAFRMLGSFAEADDAVQEAWIRLSRADSDEIKNLSGWLTTVVSRICLDQLRHQRSRGELPSGLEPAVSAQMAAEGLGPEDEALLSDAVGRALLTVLHVLTPPERLAFVLHDMFQVPFVEIGSLLDRSPGAVKMMASRARHRVRGGETSGETSEARRREIVAAFIAAARGGDLDALIQVLDPNVVLKAEVPDLGEVVVEGAAAVSARAVLFGAEDTRSVLAMVNGTTGLLTLRGDVVVAAMQVDIRHDRIVELRLTTNPNTLGNWDKQVLPVADQ